MNNTIQFVNETLWPGNLGHFFVILAFVSSLLAGFIYFKNIRTINNTEVKFANIVFKIHSIAVLGIFVTLFYIIFKHLYEYHYAWRHSSNTLPLKYMISCFWEGQEGSFLLWMFWTAVIGLLILIKPTKFTPGVLAIIALTQVALGSMLLGVHVPFLDFTIGSSPFDLLRVKSPDIFDIPIMASVGNANYLQIYKDGNGLNQLLQNPWMVIHPPTLFFGFASAVVPFAYSITAIWIGEERAWLKPALKWSLICVGILGTGIMMGGWWAYESLSFGGYWAWDPVENASLLPWLILVAGMHLILISISTGRQFFGSHLLIQLSFILVLYATFLTRSGILGEASVHSFTDLGLSGQLLLFLFVFIWVCIVVTNKNPKMNKLLTYGIPLYVVIVILVSLLLPSTTMVKVQPILKWMHIVIGLAGIAYYIYNLNKLSPKPVSEEKIHSREFWMLVGSLVLILSLVQVISTTSMPVINKLFGTTMAIPQAQKYNDIQIWMAMPILICMAIGQWFRYKQSDLKQVFNNLIISGCIAILLTLILTIAWKFNELRFVLFLLFSVWVIVSNIHYWIKNKKIGFFKSASSISHIGFGVLLLGVIVSSVNKKVLSFNEKSLGLVSETNDKGQADIKAMEFNRQNRLLNKNESQLIGSYLVNYFKDTTMGENGIDKVFSLKFETANSSFELNPKIQNNPKMGLVAEPSTKHFIDKDVFTHVNYESSQDKEEPFSGFVSKTVKEGEIFLSNSGKITLQILKVEKAVEMKGLAVRFTILAKRLMDTAFLYPIFTLDPITNEVKSIAAKEDLLGLLVSVENIIPNKENTSYLVSTGEKDPIKPYIVLKVLLFPWINLVWLGTIMVAFGFGIAVYNRSKQIVNFT